jgi:hypothetical protein
MEGEAVISPQWRGAAPPDSYQLIAVAYPPPPAAKWTVELPHDDSFLNKEIPLYEPGLTLEQAVEHLGIETQPRPLPPR